MTGFHPAPLLFCLATTKENPRLIHSSPCSGFGASHAFCWEIGSGQVMNKNRSAGVWRQNEKSTGTSRERMCQPVVFARCCSDWRRLGVDLRFAHCWWREEQVTDAELRAVLNENQRGTQGATQFSFLSPQVVTQCTTPMPWEMRPRGVICKQVAARPVEIHKDINHNSANVATINSHVTLYSFMKVKYHLWVDASQMIMALVLLPISMETTISQHFLWWCASLSSLLQLLKGILGVWAGWEMKRKLVSGEHTLSWFIQRGKLSGQREYIVTTCSACVCVCGLRVGPAFIYGPLWWTVATTIKSHVSMCVDLHSLKFMCVFSSMSRWLSILTTTSSNAFNLHTLTCSLINT